MDDQNKNLILATVLSFLVILGWYTFFPPPEPEQAPETAVSETAPAGDTALAPSAAADAVADTAAEEAGAPDAPRVAIDTARLAGSISLQGGRIDDLSLKDYRETLDEGSPIVKLLKPVGDAGAYYALYGWAPGAGLSLDDVPGANTVWTAPANAALSTDSPVTLTWDNGKGLTFSRTIAVDEDYMFSVTQSVANASGGSVALAPYGTLARHGQPADLKNFFILHEGAVAIADEELIETDWDDIAEAERGVADQ